MSDEVFLARWSRRKREAKAVANVPPPTEPAGTPNPPPLAAAENPPDAEVDLSSLPPIDSIDAATDITAFLRKGIPQELGRAALRRAWAADPAIRDFVGPPIERRALNCSIGDPASLLRPRSQGCPRRYARPRQSGQRARQSALPNNQAARNRASHSDR
ncbi:MAG: DUF3306 domain-containing protein [Bradyrhizobium sp.]